MLVLQNLHGYLTQILSPPAVHTALLLTPEGALVSYAARTHVETEGDCASDGRGSESVETETEAEGRTNERESEATSSTPRSTVPGPSSPGTRSKDEIRMVASLSAEVWGDTEGGGECSVESEVSVL